VILAVTAAVAQKRVEEQKGDTPLVRVVKRLLALPPGFSSGFSEKQANRPGDRVSVALLKIYSEEELQNPANDTLGVPLPAAAPGHG
jgi:hypothetical protein